MYYTVLYSTSLCNTTDLKSYLNEHCSLQIDNKYDNINAMNIRTVKILLLMTLHSFSLEESCCSSIWFSTCSSSESLWLVSFNYCQRERVLLHLLATIWKGGENCQEDQNQGNSFLELFVSGAKAQGVRKCVISRKLHLSEWRLFNFT